MFGFLKNLKNKKSKKIRKKKSVPVISSYPDGFMPPPMSIFETSFFLQLPIIRHLCVFLRLVVYFVIDSINKLAEKEKLHLYGIWCYVGLPGSGKTMSLVYYLDDLRRKYKDKIYIITNFGYIGQDFELKSWDVVTEDYDRPVIFAWDELQNEFNSRQYRNFPTGLIHELTQNRKGNGKQIIYTTQIFTAVDNNFRNLTSHVYDCRTYFNRFTVSRKYKREFYEALVESKSINNKFKIKPVEIIRFIQTEDIRSRYDSFLRLDYLKSLDIVRRS